MGPTQILRFYVMVVFEGLEACLLNLAPMMPRGASLSDCLISVVIPDLQAWIVSVPVCLVDSSGAIRIVDVY